MLPASVDPTDTTFTEPEASRHSAALDAARAPRRATSRQIRGSSLLLAGRILSKSTNLVVQILTVRYLSVSDYGAFAYALAIVTLGQTVARGGLDRAVTRFVPMYQEREDYPRLFGTLMMVSVLVVSLGTAIAVGFQLLGAAYTTFLDNPQARAVLLVLVFLVPVQAVDDLIVGLFAVFAKPRAIFFRRHVLAPGLKLSVVVLLVFWQSTVLFLAAGYLVSSLIGVGVYVVLLARLIRSSGLSARFALGNVLVPWREVLAFTVPLLISDLVFVVMNSMTVVILEYFRGFDGVASLRAQQPIAAVNQIVMVSFATLFTPAAARMFARNDREGVNDLYWRTAMWIAVLSFPIFALTCSLAGPTTRLLLGVRYSDSAGLLALLAIGYYFNAALGFNGLTLKIYGKLRYVIAISLATVAVSLAANLMLIPVYGAMGAAIATCFAMVVHNILKQTGLRLGTGINVFEWRYFRGYCVILLSAVGVWVFEWLTAAPIPVSLAVAGVASYVVFRCNRHLLEVEDTFPEILRVPFARRLLGPGTRSD